MIRGGLRLAALALLALAAGCGGAKAKPGGSSLELSVAPAPPARLAPGTVVRVTARPVPPVAMAWVSGTVQIMGAKPLAMKPDKDGKGWSFKTMVPPMVTVPAGKYELKAWGRTRDGEPVEGLMQYEVK